MPQANPSSYLLQPRPYPERLSLVIPLYNEEAAIPFLRDALRRFLPALRCETEFILVNDGSIDSSLKLLVE
jgi:glycosyltransferase involved in cell wall biosynthesis